MPFKRASDLGAKARKITIVPTHNSLKTHCPYGHLYDEANTYKTTVGRRQCKACKAERQRLTPSERVQRRKNKVQTEEAHKLAAERDMLVRQINDTARRSVERINRLKARLKALTPATPPTPTTCSKGHPIPPDRKTCPSCAKGHAIRRFYAKKGS